MSEIRQIFESDYCGIDTFLTQILSPIFGDYEKGYDVLTADKDVKEKATQANILEIKHAATFDFFGNELKVYDITVGDEKKLENNKVGIQNIVRQYIAQFEGALILFHHQNVENQEWRLSYVEKRTNATDSTSAKRYTYILGKNKHCRTIADRFKYLTEKKDIITLSDLTDAFSVESLTKQFYKELFSWYEWASEIVTFPKGDTTKNSKGAYNVIQSKEYNNLNLIRLITRLMFVWFIKQKELIPSWIFDKKELNKILTNFNPESNTEGNYYNAVIQNLFFATLNKKIEDRAFADDDRIRNNTQFGVKNYYRDNKESTFFTESNNEIIERFKPVPFLNGGLFECLDKLVDNEDCSKNIEVFTDGFSREPKWMAFVPNCLFWQEDESQLGLINLLNRYNFTVEENTPSDVQVALDPELLGKVFENLLGTYNPETSETARKDSGSFYTPREIVNFMIDESIKNYLEKNSNVTKKQIEELFDDNITEYKQDNKNEIVTLLKNIKILDPACGSGAFPMGALQKLLYLIKKSNGVEENQKDIYKLKLDLIENCLYGVDIQPIAVQICKLRFFISLICEQEKNEILEDNYGFNPLPNLETKFVAANTLIGLNSQEKEELGYSDENVEDLKNKLINVRKEHFNAKTAKEKSENRKEDEKLRKEIIDYLKEKSPEINKAELVILNEQKSKLEKEIQSLKPDITIEKLHYTNLFGEEEVKEIKTDKNETKRKAIQENLKAIKKEITNKENKNNKDSLTESLEELVKWNPYDQSAEANRFFDSDWMFNIKDGFDIVIGNPPYIQLQKDSGKLANLYENQNYETFTKMGDIYCLFYEKGFNLLKANGHLCFITSNKWMRAGYGDKLREFLATNTNPKILIDFAGVKIFESATVDTNILLFSKSINEHKTTACLTKNLTVAGLSNLSDFVSHNSSICSFSSSDSWVILSPIEQSIKIKIESIGTPLKDWDIQINYGIKTGFNDAFIISTEKRNEILNNCASEEERKKTDELIRPILRGRDIKRYGYDWADLWLINTHNGIKEKNIPRIDIENYPAVKKHLDEYWDKLSKRADKGDTPYNLRNCAYMDDFNKPKIFWAELARTGNSFIYTEEKIMAIAGVFILTMSDDLEKEVGYKFLTMFLNCPIALFYFDMIYSKLDNTGWQWKKEPIEKLPIPLLNKDKQSKILKLYDELLEESFNTDEIIAKISLEIFSIFNLTREEINSVYERTIVFNNEFEIIKKIY